jgi:hypothetical protein
VVRAMILAIAQTVVAVSGIAGCVYAAFRLV